MHEGVACAWDCSKSGKGHVARGCLVPRLNLTTSRNGGNLPRSRFKEGAAQDIRALHFIDIPFRETNLLRPEATSVGPRQSRPSAARPARILRAMRKRGVEVLIVLLIGAILVAIVEGTPRGKLGPYRDSIAALHGLDSVSCGVGGGVSHSFNIDPALNVPDALRKELPGEGWTVTEDDQSVTYRKTFGSWVPDRGLVFVRKGLFLEKHSVSASFGHVSLWLALANVAFFVFHTALILFNVFGWLVPKLRKWNLATLGLTLFSWVAMGFWKGMGYCICTDLHWQVREAMGIRESADSYLILLVRLISGWDPPVALVNNIAAAVYLTSLTASIILNVIDWRQKKVAPGV